MAKKDRSTLVPKPNQQKGHGRPKDAGKSVARPVPPQKPPPIPKDDHKTEPDAPPTQATSGDAATDESLITLLLHSVLISPEHRLEKREEIGRGGMGSISTIFDHSLQRPLAQKALLSNMRGSPLLVRAFLREAQVTAQLEHPNIVPVHDIGLDAEGRIFFTMKRIEGRTLARILEEASEGNRFIDEAYENLLNLLEIIIKVCDALAFAHSRGVIHCDIKAQNIMVGDYGQVYLMDWGFAQLLPKKEGDTRRVEDTLPLLPANRRDGFVFGTPGYMSPEQAQGQTDKMDERSDIFSIGALLYQILTGDVPYRGKNPAESILLAQRCQYAPLEEQSVGVYSLRPKELVRIVLRAMSKSPEDRYPSIEALKSDLLHFLRGSSSFPSRRVPAGTLIIREGEEADAAYIIMSGQCEVYKMVGGRRVTLNTLKSGEIFGEMALLASSPRIASVVALTDTHLVVVTRDAVERELNSMKPWMGAFIRALASRFRVQQEERLLATPNPESEPAADDVALLPGRDPETALTELPGGVRRWWKFW